MTFCRREKPEKKVFVPRKPAEAQKNNRNNVSFQRKIKIK
ncbi:hypothetical protein HMPREF9151_00117 [Hoylesella saccharolytica F0055]|uniref:Uncharacterized protein n=1 Tax=Hoylesella saccharolytica F0055 TaxID=1127699 RepID=L1NKZ8_9BACT|nr:hypothetical protein HMPREF9151_00117 [Hoylesella saccharolytica F0055]